MNVDKSEPQKPSWYDEGSLDLSIVVPYFNPGNALRPNIDSLIEALNKLNVSFEIIAVSDGSTDGSEQTLEGLPESIFRSVVYKDNQGKGQALRTGFVHGRGRYLGFIDADGDIAPSTVNEFWELAKSGQADIVYGNKLHKKSQVQYPFIRRVYSLGYQKLVRVLFWMNVRDTQVGIKLIRRDVVASCLTRMLEKRFAFDLELFVVANHLGFHTFVDAPLQINHQFTSTVGKRTVIGMILDTLAIFYRLRFRHYYDRPHRTINRDGTIENLD